MNDPWRELLGRELVFAAFHRKRLWSVAILATWYDRRRGGRVQCYALSYDMHWHRQAPHYTCEEVGSSPYNDRMLVRPFHPTGPYGGAVTYWVKEGFRIESYQGSQLITDLPSGVSDLFFLKERREAFPLS